MTMTLYLSFADLVARKALEGLHNRDCLSVDSSQAARVMQSSSVNGLIDGHGDLEVALHAKVILLPGQVVNWVCGKSAARRRGWANVMW